LIANLLLFRPSALIQHQLLNLKAKYEILKHEITHCRIFLQVKFELHYVPEPNRRFGRNPAWWGFRPRLHPSTVHMHSGSYCSFPWLNPLL
jgi:hypothetical protein